MDYYLVGTRQAERELRWQRSDRREYSQRALDGSGGEEVEETKGRAKDQMVEAEKEDRCGEFRERFRRKLSVYGVLPDNWVTTGTVIRKEDREVFCVSSGQRKNDKETCWCNEVV